MDRNIMKSFYSRFPSVQGSVRNLTSDVLREKPVVTDVAGQFGIASLDVLTGGLPRGVTELYGEPGVGKSTLLGVVGAQAQRDRKIVGLVQSEYLDGPYLETLGLRLDQVPLFRQAGQDLIETTAQFVAQPNAVLCIDSLTALRPELEEPLAWEEWASRYLDTLLSSLGLKSYVVLTNQVRSVRSQVPNRMFSGTDSSARRIPDRFGLRLELSRQDVSEHQYWMVLNVIYNVTKKPCGLARLLVRKGFGIDILRDLLDTAVGAGQVRRTGSTYWFRGIRLGVGRDQTIEVLRQDRGLQRSVRSSL